MTSTVAPGATIDGLVGGLVLTPTGLVDAAVTWTADGRIDDIGGPSPAAPLDASGALVLPGIVDLHGDAFERTLSPRSGVHLAVDIALWENDRHLLGSGITTSYLSATDSWEPGLRSRATLRELVEALGRLPLAVDTRLHVRHEQTNTVGHDELLGWLLDGTIAMLSLNDHSPGPGRDEAARMAWYLRGRLGDMDQEALLDLIEASVARRDEGAEQVVRLCAAARRAGVVIASHDVASAEQVTRDEELGVTVAEFPITLGLASLLHQRATRVLMGAPNVVRGGSHLGNLSVADAVAAGTVDILCSDYHYPSLLQAPFVLARSGLVPFAEAWALVSSNPADAARLGDRGVVAPGRRADLVVVDDPGDGAVRVRAVVRGGRPVAWYP